MKTLRSRFIRMLRWSEKYTKTDMRYLAGATWWLGGMNAFGSLAGLALTFGLATFLTPEAFGTYKYILSLFGIVIAVSLGGMNTAVTRAVARGYEGEVRAGFHTSLRWSGPMVLLAVGIALYHFYTGATDIGIALLIIAIAAPLSQNANIFTALLLGRQDFRRLAFTSAVTTFIPAAAALIAAFISRDALITTASYLLGLGITTSILYIVTLRRARPGNVRDPETIGYGKHLSLMGVLGNVSLQADRILVFHFLGAVQLAVYSLALAVPQQLRVGSKILASAALPKLSAGAAEPIRASLPRKSLVVLVVSVLLTSLYLVLAAPFFRLFFPEYIAAIPYSQLFALVILFFPASLYQQFLTARMEKRRLYILQTIVPAIKIALLFLLIPWFGLYGAVWSILGMEVFRLLLVLYFVHGPQRAA